MTCHAAAGADSEEQDISVECKLSIITLLTIPYNMYEYNFHPTLFILVFVAIRD